MKPVLAPSLKGFPPLTPLPKLKVTKVTNHFEAHIYWLWMKPSLLSNVNSLLGNVVDSFVSRGHPPRFAGAPPLRETNENMPSAGIFVLASLQQSKKEALLRRATAKRSAAEAMEENALYSLLRHAASDCERWSEATAGEVNTWTQERETVWTN